LGAASRENFRFKVAVGNRQNVIVSHVFCP
jgi:hypothetical protein